MKEENTVLCCSNAYEKKFYLNQDFQALPQHIKDQLKIMCVLYTEEIGGILTLEYDENGTLEFSVRSEEGDFFFDEIGSVLRIKELQRDKRELLESLELFYKVFFLEDALHPGE